MNAISTLAPALPATGFRAAIRHLALAGLCLLVAACGGHADAPPPPETVPLVVTQPADQSVVVGSVATFNVVASGAAPLSYQWASSSDGTTFTALAGATGARHDTGATALGHSAAAR